MECTQVGPRGLCIAIAGRPYGSPSYDECLTVASAAFALDTVSGADRSH